jgi:hypothetical protein
MKTRTTILLILISSGFYFQASSQELINPLNFPIQLSGGFCDLRQNHFHAGIDLRTKGTVGHAVHAVAEGYISKISVSPWGYGNAVYITHPGDSIITVYGHLQKFAEKPAKIIKEKQYEKESFTVEINPDPGLLPVQKGEIIGYSGNSGSSGGPHLHFEIRDIRNNELLDPLTYYKSQITDTRKPVVLDIMIHPFEGKGRVNGSNKKQQIKFKPDKNGNPVVTTSIEAWGEVGLSIRAVDRMDCSSFSYGIKDILQTVDGVETYRSSANSFSLSESKYINSYTDYEEWSENRRFYIKTFVEPGNRLNFIASRNSGKTVIKEERVYSVKITITDHYGNKCVIPVEIKGKKQEIPEYDTTNTTLLKWHSNNDFRTEDLKLSIPENSLYKNVYMAYSKQKSDKYFSHIHILSAKPEPLHKPAVLSIRIDSVDPDVKNRQLGIVSINTGNGRQSWIGGAFSEGRIETEINDLRAYAVACDVTAPKITLLNPDNLHSQKCIKVKITDDLSGIKTFRGEIDGKYALFEYDGKNSLLTYCFDDEKLFPGYHKLLLTVIDRCGNKTEYKNAFTW